MNADRTVELVYHPDIPLGYMDPALWRLSRAEMPSLLKTPASAVQTFVRAACTRRRHPMVRRDAPYSSGQQSLWSAAPPHLLSDKPAERLGALGVRPPVYVLPFDCCCDAGPLWTWACCHRRRHEGPPVSALLSRNGSRAHAWSKRDDGLALRLRLFNGNKGPHSGDAALIMEGSEQQVHRKILFFMTKTTRRLVWPGDQDRPLARRPTFVAQKGAGPRLGPRARRATQFRGQRGPGLCEVPWQSLVSA